MGVRAGLALLIATVAAVTVASSARAITINEFSIGITPGSAPVNLAGGSDGNVWFTELNGPRIGRITPEGAITEFSQKDHRPDGRHRSGSGREHVVHRER